MGFQKALGLMNVVTAELQVIKIGLTLCKHLNLTKVKLFSNSLEAINLLMRDGRVDYRFRELLDETRSLIYYDWEVNLLHAYKESIVVADFLAKNANDVGHEVVLMNSALDNPRDLLQRDLEPHY
ncbi:uncharacterized protein LOC129296418 [Prosopis cineraria]|uniref:uncharacterized protein LOC129296418 n=1 Tax=Prosopis cineraria TaxID=364024 RepID=UPI00240F708E|nr:uncharacterized protein LOC129296418 [Prosopis cineraria]